MKKSLKAFFLTCFCFPLSLLAQINTDASGNVGIGTTTVENSEGWGKVLEVKGDAHAKILTATSSVYTGLWSHNFGFFNAPAGGYVGTWSNHPFALITNSASRLFINTNGYIGVGTTTPSSKLHVYDDNVFQAKLHGAGWWAGVLMQSSHPNSTKQLGMHFGSDGTTGINTNSLRFGRYSLNSDWEANPVMFDLDAPDASLILTEDGSVGIGTASPGAKLDVAGGIRATNMAVAHNGDNVVQSIEQGNTYHLIGTYWGWDRKAVFIAGYNVSNNPGIATERVYIGHPDSDKYLSVNFLNGHVGIGTNNVSDPAYRLFVETGIRTRKVKVDQTAWADYVFAPSYQLPSLKDVEQYILDNQHLPEVPSAQEVDEHGLDLGENQAVLLKKIEELTLYVIEADKKNQAQVQKNQALEEQNKALEERLRRLEEKLK